MWNPGIGAVVGGGSVIHCVESRIVDRLAEAANGSRKPVFGASDTPSPNRSFFRIHLKI